VAAALPALHWADTFIAANSESTTNTANTGKIAFLMFFSPYRMRLMCSHWDQAIQSFDE
jgi:hypothetical protein